MRFVRAYPVIVMTRVAGLVRPMRPSRVTNLPPATNQPQEISVSQIYPVQDPSIAELPVVEEIEQVPEQVQIEEEAAAAATAEEEEERQEPKPTKFFLGLLTAILFLALVAAVTVPILIVYLRPISK